MTRDILVIGGGINGVGIAADAAGRGLSVTLCEMHDLASATSSASSKLIHGGLRYLENYEFKLVRESLQERQILRRLAPHMIHTQPFVMPHCPWLRPYWVIRSGLFLYDYLAFDPQMPKSGSLNPQEIAKLGLKQQYKKALRYYDCTEDDSRLVINVALLAQQHGAQILIHTKVVAAQRHNDCWRVTLENTKIDGSVSVSTLDAKVIVNAAGPWAQHVANKILHVNTKHKIKLVKGSHIIVPRLFQHDQAFVLQNNDGRIVFLIPYFKDFTLIGTTDILLDQITYPALISKEEIAYLCDITNQFTAQRIIPSDIVHHFSGIRPLFDDHHHEASKITRDYVIDVDVLNHTAPAFTIFGGKVTTYRKLAEVLCNKLTQYLPNCGAAWTAQAYLPGGQFNNGDVNTFTQELINTHQQLPAKLLVHYVQTYGTRCLEILRSVQQEADLGIYFGGLLYQREVDYLVQHEWARTASDILWRRGKMGLWFNAEQVAELARYLS